MTIKILSTLNIYDVLSGITNITDLCTVFNQLPPEKAEPQTPYIFLSKVTDNNSVTTNKGTVERVARVSITVVGNIWGDDQETIEEIRNTITNEVVYQWCSKITQLWGLHVNTVTLDTVSPMLYDDKRRQYIVQDYLFKYSTK